MKKKNNWQRPNQKLKQKLHKGKSYNYKTRFNYFMDGNLIPKRKNYIPEHIKNPNKELLEKMGF